MDGQGPEPGWFPGGAGGMDSLFIAEGRRIGVLSILTGEQNDILQDMAEAHAEYQADHCTQGHQHWEQRFHQLERELPLFRNFREIANESWPDQNEQEAAVEMFKSWRKSRGHWETANGKCDIWGYSMSRGRNGTWYAAGICADRRGIGGDAGS